MIGTANVVLPALHAFEQRWAVGKPGSPRELIELVLNIRKPMYGLVVHHPHVGSIARKNR